MYQVYSYCYYINMKKPFIHHNRLDNVKQSDYLDRMKQGLF